VVVRVVARVQVELVTQVEQEHQIKVMRVVQILGRDTKQVAAAVLVRLVRLVALEQETAVMALHLQ
jgi:hypothetical protein